MMVYTCAAGMTDKYTGDTRGDSVFPKKDVSGTISLSLGFYAPHTYSQVWMLRNMSVKKLRQVNGKPR
jgi:hypothetical protein